MLVEDYFKYVAGAQYEASPLFLSDKHFAASAPQLVEDFTVPGHSPIQGTSSEHSGNIGTF
jgi:hypothetical protein